MTNFLRLKSIAFLLLSTILIFSCEKDEPSPTTETGTTKAASANLVANSWAYSSPSYYTEFSISELTASKINSAAAVLVYFSTDGNNWVALPFTYYSNNSSNYFMGFSYSIGKVQITWTYDNTLSKGDNPNIYFGTNVQFKVVVISSAARVANSDVDLNNFEEVKERFEISEN